MSFINGEGALNRLQYLGRVVFLWVVITSIVVFLTISNVDPKTSILALFPIHMALFYCLIKQRVNSFNGNPKLSGLWLLGLLIPGINLILGLILLFKVPHKPYMHPDRFISPSLIVAILFSFVFVYFG